MLSFACAPARASSHPVWVREMCVSSSLSLWRVLWNTLIRIVQIVSASTRSVEGRSGMIRVAIISGRILCIVSRAEVVPQED